MFQIGVVSPNLILKHLISLGVSLAQLVSPNGALLAEFVLVISANHACGFATDTRIPVGSIVCACHREDFPLGIARPG